jgi:hypothetical protein
MSSTTREFPLSEEIKQSLKITRIYAEGKTLFVENRRSEPITCPYTGELNSTVDGLKQALVKTGEFDEKSIDEFLRLLADVWRRQEEESPFEEDEGTEKKYYVQKYTTGISPAESILIGGTKPMFLQIIDGKAVLSKKIPLPGNITLRPLDKVSYLSKEYLFSSPEEINTYVAEAEKETLDSLYDRVKSIWKKYVDADDFHIVICAADTLFTYFQDKLGMTHYLLFLAPSFLTISSLSFPRPIAMVLKPILEANCIPRCPSPPTPNIATTSPSRAPLFRRALYVVTPAHIIGAASVAESSSGIAATASVGAII